MKNKIQGSVFVAGVAVMAGLGNNAYAYPMFGKQTGLDCTACHLQHMPKLNETGRKFAASGMTQSVNVADPASKGMDINPSVMVKSMYEKTWDKPTHSGLVNTTADTEEGEWSVPRTASLMFGGRLTEHLGGFIDASYKSNEDNSVGGKVVYARDTTDGYWGLAFYNTPSFGPFAGMETYNSGLYKPLRTFDIRKLSNAFQASEIGGGSARGVQLYCDTDNALSEEDHLFATFGVYAPEQENDSMNFASNMIPFARVAYEYRAGDFNFILGGFGMKGGSTAYNSLAPLSIERETYGIDFQIEGIVAERRVSLIVANVLRNKVTYTGLLSNQLDPEENSNLENTAWSVEGEVNLFPSFGLKAAYMTFDDQYDYYRADKHDYQANHIDVRDLDYAVTVGADYSFSLYLPMKLTAEYAWAKPSLERVKDYEDFLVSLNILF